MVHWLRTLSTLVEDPGSVYYSHILAYSHLYLQFQGIQYLSLASISTRHAHSTVRYMQAK